MRRALWALSIALMGVLLSIRLRSKPEAPPPRPDAAVLKQTPSHAAYRHDDGRTPPVNGAIVTRKLANEPANLPQRYDDGRVAPAEAVQGGPTR